MVTISTDTILTAIKAGTYTLDTITTSRMFKTEQPPKRRRYPSIELLETPQGNTETNESTKFVRKFDIRIYLGLRGGTTTGQEDEISDLETLEEEILAVMDSTSLDDHKIIVEERSFNRHYDNVGLRPYVMSTLTIVIRHITGTTNDSPDGVLIYDISESTADSKPASDYTYTNVYNVEINEGYEDNDEFITSTENPQKFAGDFSGTFIGNIKVKAADLGSTSEKLDKLKLLQSNGEKQTVGFKYTNKSADSPTTSGIQRDLVMTITSIQERYIVNDVTVFRILGQLIQPSATTVI